MKRILAAVILIPVFLISCVEKEAGDIKVMTLNIRLDTPRDSINAWPNRASIVAGFVREHSPDLLGMQEVLWHQYTYLDSTLEGYGSIAAGRDDGKMAGEASPVFYRKERFDPLTEGTFWLSATPDVPGSIGWGAAFTRIATWIRLTDKQSGDTLLYVNTHFDHISDSARVMGAHVLLGRVRELAGGNDFIITGDFNSLPGSPAISVMGEGGFARDSYTISETPPAGMNYTFNGWKDEPGEGRIDYIFVRDGMKVLSHETYRVIRDGVFISDHWPVIALIR